VEHCADADSVVTTFQTLNRTAANIDGPSELALGQLMCPP
jgi:hypothetical protein